MYQMKKSMRTKSRFVMKKLRIAYIGYIVISIVFCFAAVLFLASAWVPPAALSIFGGVCLLAYGIIKIIGYFSEDLYCLAFRYDLAFGLLLLVIGFIVLLKFAAAANWLSMGIGWLSLLDSVLKIQMAQEARNFGLEKWKVMVTTAIITGVLSVLLILRDITVGGKATILTALALLAIGVMNYCTVKFAIKKPSDIQKIKRSFEE